MLLASSISSPRDPVAATFSLPARSTKHSFPPAGCSPGPTGGICWDWGIRAWFPRRPPVHTHVTLYTLRRTLAEDPAPAPSPGWATHALAADMECEQGMASAGGLVQGVS